MNKDYQRQHRIESLGWRFERFTGSQIYNHPKKCVNHIINILNIDNKK